MNGKWPLSWPLLWPLLWPFLKNYTPSQVKEITAKNMQIKDEYLDLEVKHFKKLSWIRCLIFVKTKNNVENI